MPDLLTVIEHPLFNAVSFFIIKYITKDAPFEEPTIISYIRYVYLLIQAIVLALHYYLIFIIKKKNDQTPLKYVEPGRTSFTGTKTADQLVNTTFIEYDILEVKLAVKQCFTSITLIVFIHLQFHFILPLIIQPIMSMKTFLISKEAQIHIWHKNTNYGELKRPFRLNSLYGMSIPENQQLKINGRAIKKAEKAKS
ncbi:unnamed protein product [Cunninghamella blakesleeana]